MNIGRRDFTQMLAFASAAGMTLAHRDVLADQPGASERLYALPPFGNVSFMHFTDCHAQLMPSYFREPSVNLGVAGATGKAPHLVGQSLLEEFGIAPGSAKAHAFTYLDFTAAVRTFGKVGGFAHLATLILLAR